MKILSTIDYIGKNLGIIKSISVKLLYQGEDKVMKSTGIVRKVDELGRVVLPIELRRTMDIEQKDSLEIYVEEGQVILKKYDPTCVFCGYSKDVSTYRDKSICSRCAEELKDE